MFGHQIGFKSHKTTIIFFSFLRGRQYYINATRWNCWDIFRNQRLPCGHGCSLHHWIHLQNQNTKQHSCPIKITHRHAQQLEDWTYSSLLLPKLNFTLLFYFMYSYSILKYASLIPFFPCVFLVNIISRSHTADRWWLAIYSYFNRIQPKIQ